MFFYPNDSNQVFGDSKSFYDSEEQNHYFNQGNIIVEKMDNIDLEETSINGNFIKNVFFLEKDQSKIKSKSYLTGSSDDILKIFKVNFNNTDKTTKEEEINIEKIYKINTPAETDINLKNISAMKIENNDRDSSIKNNEIININKLRDKIFRVEKEPKYQSQAKKKAGRKRKEEKIIRKHNEKSNDNIINKIKGHFFGYVREITKDNIKDKKLEFKKFPHAFIANLSKKNNERLFDMKMRNILYEEKITTKNKKSHIFENRYIIRKIENEKKEDKVIKILNLTFNELFLIYRHKMNLEKDKEEIQKIAKNIEGLDLLDANKKYKDALELINKIREDRGKTMSEEELEEYIKKVKNLLGNYKEWFINKKSKINGKNKK